MLLDFLRKSKFPKHKEINKVCSDTWTYSKMWKQYYFYVLKLSVAFKIGLFYLFQFKGNLKIPQKVL